ncbi:hypothetical protein FGB62_11g17 [Gracilaria domingensis]|nr:hypothetical protein FGB62_11g17 [Gracilaria domingensis]
MPRRNNLKVKSVITKLREKCRMEEPHFRIKKRSDRVPPPTATSFRKPTLIPPAHLDPCSPNPRENEATPSTAVILTDSPNRSRPLRSVPAPCEHEELTPLSLGRPVRPVGPVVVDPVQFVRTVEESNEVICIDDSEDEGKSTAEAVGQRQPAAMTRRKLTRLDCLRADWEQYEKHEGFYPTFFDSRPSLSAPDDDDSAEDAVATRSIARRFAAGRLPPPRKSIAPNFESSANVDNDGFVDVSKSSADLEKFRRKKVMHPRYRRFR